MWAAHPARRMGAVNCAPMQRLVILISGQGSNMLALAQACRQENWPAQVVGVVSNRPLADGLVRARELGLHTEVLEVQPGESREAYDERLSSLLDGLRPDWILLAGFMRILSATFISRFAGRIINIHPSLLPAFPGLHTHRQALAAGVREHGATVHFVIPALDAGPAIAQATVPVLPDDTEASLAAAVLEMEHLLYPAALRALLSGAVRYSDGQVIRLAVTLNSQDSSQ